MSPGPGPGVDLLRLALRRAGRVRFRVLGGSMRPSLHDGDVVSVVPADFGQLAVGDVICYEREHGRLAVHRLVARDGPYLVTKGDALSWVDRVPAGRVLGRVATVERRSLRERLRTGFARAGRGLRRPWRGLRRMLGHA